MDYQVTLNNGQSLKLINAEIDTKVLAATLNNRETSFITIANSVINKNLIGTVTPIVSTDVANYRVLLNNNQVIGLNVPDISVEALAETLNNRDITFIDTGGAVINKNLIGTISPVA